MSKHTKGPLQVRMNGRCSGAWAEVGHWIESEGGREWRMLAQTDTTHVEKTDSRGRPIKGDVGDINAVPLRFALKDDGAELIANAHLFAAAPELLECLQYVMKTHSMVASERSRISAAIALATGATQ